MLPSMLFKVAVDFKALAFFCLCPSLGGLVGAQEVGLPGFFL